MFNAKENLLSGEDSVSSYEEGMATLDRHHWSMMILERGSLVISSEARGIKPLYTVYTSGKRFDSALLIDKVIGLGAAGIAAQIGVKEVWTQVVSRPAKEFFEKCGIAIHYEKLTEHILNREGTGTCPVESIALRLKLEEESEIGKEKFEAMIQDIRVFLVNIGMLE
jgi:hypothetical protein